MDISFNVEQALDKLDMMSFEEAQEWIAELSREEARDLVRYLLGQIRYKQACDDVLLPRGRNTKTIEPEFKDGSCVEWLNKLANKDV